MAILNIPRAIMKHGFCRRPLLPGWPAAMRWMLVALILGTAATRAQVPQEYKVKAVLLYNFIQFATWPQNAFESPRSPWVVGVLGSDPFGEELERTFRNEIINNRPFVIRRYQTVEEIGVCHLLFISRSENHRLQEIFRLLAGRSILTVGESEGFAEAGGMIRFWIEQNRVRLQVNPEAARRANLSLSSKLLRLAELVEEKPPAEDEKPPLQEKL